MSLHEDLQIEVNFVSDLPNEISEIIFLDLPPKTLLNCRRVSKSWKHIVDNDYIWKSKFLEQKSWKYYNDDSETDSWYELYKYRYTLKLNWKNDKFTQYKLQDPSTQVFCGKCFKNWIITGLKDGTIKIWDIETFRCLRVLGELTPEILKQLGTPNLKSIRESLSDMEKLELTKDTDTKVHLGEVSCMDINDKYLVSGSFDGSCIIWTLPDFKPIDSLKIPTGIGEDIYINDVVIYNDYIVCCRGNAYIEIWKSSFTIANFEHHDQLQFNLQHRSKGETTIYRICIHDDIIYTEGCDVVTTWNIETGLLIQEFRYNVVICMTVKDQYLFVNNCYELTVWDLETNKLINTISDSNVNTLRINDNKILYVSDVGTIKIRDLNDQKLLKEYSNSDPVPFSPIYIDSKRIVVLTKEGEVVIYDFTENLRKKYLKHL